MKKTIRKWTAAWVAIAFTWMAIGIFSPDQIKAGTAKTESTASTVETVKSDNSENNSFEKEGTTPEITKRKKFPWLWVAAGVVVAGVIVYFTLIKKPKYDLLVETGTGVTGTPTVGKYTYKKGGKIAYNFSCTDGYKNLSVLLDGKTAAASGIIVMDKAHALKVTATQIAEYNLVVNISTGITGTPAAGNYSYREGSLVAYRYTPATGYKNMLARLDGETTASSGTVIMDRHHTLEVTSLANDQYTLTVRTDDGIEGYPAAGTYLYKKGTAIPYQYTADKRFANVKLDGKPIPQSGMFYIFYNHVLEASGETQPDIHGKWAFYLIKNGDSKAFPRLLILFSKEKRNFSEIDIVLEDPSIAFWKDLWGWWDWFEVSLNQAEFAISDGATDYYNFVGIFKCFNTMSGHYEYTRGDPRYLVEKGTWTATRIE